jgi:hypothetical protein
VGNFKELLRQFRSSRTNLLQVLVVVLSALQVYVFQFDLNAETVFGLTTAFGVANIFLRYLTTIPVSEK